MAFSDEDMSSTLSVSTNALWSTLRSCENGTIINAATEPNAIAIRHCPHKAVYYESG